MKIKSDLLQVQHVPYAEDGTKIEPEQQAAARVIIADAPVGMNAPGAVEAKNPDGTVGAMPIRVIAESSAGTLAMVVRSRCRTCKHFDRAAWRKLLAKADSVDAPMASRLMINDVRASLLMSDNADVVEANTISPTEPDFDVEAALHSMGVCHPLTEMKKDLVIVHPLSGCPIEAASPERPEGYYTPRSVDAEKQANAAYDEVMRAAQGQHNK